MTTDAELRAAAEKLLAAPLVLPSQWERLVRSFIPVLDRLAAAEARVEELAKSGVVIERAARAYDPVGWGWYDRAKPDHPGKSIFYADAMERMQAALRDALTRETRNEPTNLV